MTKKELRKIYKEKRLSLPARDVLRLDDLLLIQFQRLHFEPGTEWLMSYVPMIDRAEINPVLFEDYLQFALPEIKITYPVVNVPEGSMQPYWMGSETEMVENEFGIMEPKAGVYISEEDIDVVFVPLLVFDRLGHRVGYGKGFYDRFFIKCPPHAIKIGFSYFEPVEHIVDTHEFDIPLNYCITPQHLYEF